MVSLTVTGQAEGSEVDTADLGGSAAGAATSGGAGADAADLGPPNWKPASNACGLLGC